jgi:hypothetical protein
MKTLTNAQANTVEALIEASGSCGAWSSIETTMREFGVDDPEAALEELRLAIQ